MTTPTHMRTQGALTQVEMRTGGFMSVYRVCEGEPPHAILILLHEIFGINANMREQANAYARCGFDVLVPDLFWRQEAEVELDSESAEDRAKALVLMKGMDQTLAVEDALEAACSVRDYAGCAQPMVAVGYCLGGKLAYLLATRKEIDAAVSYYGVGIHAALDRAPEVRCPLLVHLAGDDSLCTPDAQQAIQQALTKNALVTVQSHVGVGHAFARLGSPCFEPVAAQHADRATSAFLRNAVGLP